MGQRSSFCIGALVLTLSLVGCGGGGNTSSGGTNPGVTSTAAAPIITSLQASALEAAPGQAVTLTAVFSGGPGTIDQGVGAVSSAQPVTVHPAADTTYTLTVSGDGGRVAKTLAIKVASQAVSLLAKKATLSSGQMIELVPSFVAGTGSIEGIGTVTSGVPIHIASPNVTTPTTVLYSLKVDTNGSISSADAKILIVPSPTISRFDVSAVLPPSAVAKSRQASPQALVVVSATATILYGGQAIVTPVFVAGTGTIEGIGPVTSGVSYPVSPLSDQTYVLRVVNDAGDVETANAQVQVLQPTISAIVPAIPSVQTGAHVSFSGAIVAGALDPSVMWSASAGTMTQDGTWVAPTTPQSVSITAASAAKSTVQQRISVAVLAAPVASGLTASPLTPAFGATFTLTPSYSGGTGSIDNSVPCPATGVASEAITANWSGPRTFILTVANGLGTPANTTVIVTPQTVSLGAVTPASPTKTVSTSTVFGATPTGGALNTVTWSSNAGTWAGSTWTAPAVPGTYTITATSVDDPSKSASTTVTVVAAPKASLSVSDPSPRQGDNITFVPTYSGGNPTWGVWSNIPSSGAVSAPIQVDWVGQRDFVLNVVSPSGTMATASVTVTPQTVFVGSISPANAIRNVGSSLTFSADSSGKVIWSSGGGTWSGSTWTSSQPGSYLITATAADDTTKTASTTVTMVASPVAAGLSATNLTPAQGSTFSLTPNYLGGTGSLDNGVACPATGVASSPIQANWSGPRTYTLTVTNDAGATTTTSATVTPRVVSVGAISPATPFVTVGNAKTFSVSVVGGALNSVSWSATGGTWLGSTWTAPAVPGTYTLMATSTDDPSKTISTTVTVVGMPTIFGFTAGAPTITAGAGTTLTAVYAGGVGAVDLAVGPVASGAMTPVAPAGTTTYTLTVTNAAGTAVTATALVTVIPAPVATGLLAAVNPVAYGGTTSVTPVFSVGVGVVDQGVGSVTSGVPFASGTITATKTFTLTVTNAVGGKATTAVTLTPQAVGVGVVSPLNPTRTVGSTTAFSASVSGTSSSALAWCSTGGTWSGSSWTAPAVPGTYMVTATSVDDATKTSTSTVTVVAAPGQPAVTAPGTVTAGRSGYVASVPAQAGVTYSWTLSSGVITGGHGSESITWTAPASSGSITVSCSIQNAAGAALVSSANVNVVAVPQVPAITVPAYVTANKGGAGASIVSQPGSTYVWGITNGLITGGQSTVAIVFTPGAGGSVVLTCSVANAEGVSSANGTATSTVVPAPVAGSLIPAKTSITLGGTTLITPTFSGGVAKIGTSGVGSSDVTAAAVSGVPVSSGVLSLAKTFTLTVTNQAGSSVSATCTVGAVAGATASISASTTSPLFAATNVTVTPTFPDAVSASVGTTQGGSEVSLWPTTGVALPVQPGGFTATQVYWLRATNSAGDNVDSRVTVTPQTVVVTPVAPLDPILTAGTTTTFSCSSTGGASSSFAWKGIAWTATGGAWNGNNWTAPLVPGSYVITAKSVDDISKFNISTVNVVPAPVINSFNASSLIITAGSSVNLTAVFTGGTASVDNGVGAIASGVAKGVTPAATTTYKLSVTNAAGTVTQANVTVTVVAVPTASSLVATLNPVPYNGTTVVTPVFAGGVGVVDQGIGSATTSVAFNSGVIIVPKTFTLTVTNAAGATATASVTVAPQAVTVGPLSPATPFMTVGYAKSFSVSVTGGATNTVTWSSTGGSWLGSSWTAPGSTGTYTITATSVDDPTKTSSTTVTVVPMPVASGLTTTNANPTYASSLTLTPTYSLGVGTIDNGVICPASGVATNSITTSWNGARTYTLTVANAAGATAMASVVVTGQTVAMTGLSPATPIRTISTNTVISTIVTGGLTNNVIWSSTGGSWTGATWTAPATPGNYTVTATSVDDPTKVVNTVVTVVGLPVATGLTTTNANPLFGATVTLTPAFSGGTGAIGYSGLNSTEIAANATSGLGVTTAPITLARTYTLTVTNAAGTTATTTVVVTPQAVVVGALSPATPTKTSGSTTVFSMAVSGGATNAVNWSSTGGSWSGATWTAPGSTGTYTITATSADDPTKTASTTVTVVAAPNIGSFVYGTSPITVGNSTTVTAVFSNGTGVVDNGVGGVTTGGAMTVTPGSTTTYTLTVTNAAGTQVQATVTMVVVAVPIASGLLASSTNPLYASTITLTPTYSNGTGSINNGVACPASGSASSAQAVNWTGGRTYILTVTNAADTAVTTNVTVTPQVVNVGALSPASPTRSVSTATTFTTVVTGGFTNNVTWSSTGGSWAGNTWTAPASPGSYTITATSVDDPSKSNSTVVTVVALPVASGLSASTTSPTYNSAFTLTPVYSNGTGTINYGVPCPGSGSASGGITANWGGGVGRTFILTVTNAAGATATANVTVTPQTVSLGSISPWSQPTTVGHARTFSVTVNGGATNSVNWSSTGGSWSGATWTAPGSAGTYTITATSVDDPSKTNSMTITVAAAPAISSFSASPSSIGGGGSSTLLPVFSGGSGWIDQGISTVYTGNGYGTGSLLTGRTYTLTVTNVAGDTATAMASVAVSAVSISGVSPSTPYVTAGLGQAFSALVSGGATNSASWSSTGGSWAGNTWTAPGSTGTYTVTATSADDPTKTASTTVTVVAAPIASGLSASNLSPAYGGTFALTPTYSGGTGSLDNGVVCPGSGSASSSITANWSGARTYTLTVNNAAGTTATKSVVVTPPSVSIAQGLGTGTSNASTANNFSATVSGAADSTVRWTASAGSVSAGTTASGATMVWTAPATPGTYTVTASSAADGSATTYWTVVVSSPSGPVFGAFDAIFTRSFVTCDDAMASGGYDTQDTFEVEVVGTWDSCVLTTPTGQTFAYGSNTGGTNQSSGVVIYTLTSGYAGGGCTAQSNTKDFVYGIAGGQWTLVATRNGQQSTWTLIQ